MNEIEQLEKAMRITDRIMDALDDGNKTRQVEFGVCMDAIAAVLVSLFIHQDFGDLPRERAMTMFLQETFCRFKDAIDRGETVSHRVH